VTPKNSDTAFLHGFEERRLRPWRRAIDFVGEHDVREDRSALEDELALSAGRIDEDVRAGDVGRHQVRRALHAGKPEIGGVAQRFDEQRLAESRRPLDERVPLTEETHQQMIDERRVPHEHAADFRLQRIEGGSERGRLRLHRIDRGHG
jgi:hypothetical protein